MAARIVGSVVVVLVVATLDAGWLSGIIAVPDVLAAGVVAIMGVAALYGLVCLTRPGLDSAGSFSRRFGRDLDDVAIGMMTLSPGLRIVWVNAALCALLGRESDRLVGRSILEFTHAEDVQRSVEWTRSRLQGNAESPLAKRYLRPDGSFVEAAVIAALVEPKGAEPYLFSQVLDVTEQRRAEREQAVIAALGRRALECADVITLMSEAMRAVRESLGTATCIATRRSASGDILLVAADGKPPYYTIPADRPSQTAFTLRVQEPVLSNDLAVETRFCAPELVVARGLNRCRACPSRSARAHAT